VVERRWLILAVLFLARVAMAFQFQAIASTMPSLMTALHIDYATVGMLIGLYMLPGVAVSIPGGLLTRRFGDIAVCAAGLALMAAGGAIDSASHTLAFVAIGRVTSGAGAMLLNLVLTKMATDWFAGREIVVAMSLMIGSWPFGVAAGLLVQPALSAAIGWRAVMLSTAVLCGIALVLMRATYRAPATAVAQSQPPNPGLIVFPPLQQSLGAIVAGTMWGIVSLALVLFFSFAPGAMAGAGLAPLTARAWTGAALWILMVSTPLGGATVQWDGRPNLAIALSSIVAAAALGLMSGGIAPPLAIVLFGVTLGPAGSVIMALPARVLSPQHRAAGLGLFMTCYYLLQALGPVLAGMLRAKAGPHAPLLLAAALMAAVLPLLTVFELLSRRPTATAVRATA